MPPPQDPASTPATPARPAGDGSPSGRASGAGVAPLQDDWYRHPLWYDILHDGDSAWEVESLERIAATIPPPAVTAAKREDAVWLEPACGTARLLRIAAVQGRRVVGVDLLPEMVAYARSSLAATGVPEARWRVLLGDMKRFESPWPADLAMCLINSIRHLEDDDAMLEHLGCMARALVPGGVYVVGLGVDDPVWTEPTEDIWKGRRDGIAITQVAQYLPPDRSADGPAARVEQVHTHLIVRTSEGTHHLDSSYTLRTWSLAQWRAILERSPLTVQAVCDAYGEREGDTVEQQIQKTIVENTTNYALWVLRRRDAEAEAVWRGH